MLYEENGPLKSFKRPKKDKKQKLIKIWGSLASSAKTKLAQGKVPTNNEQRGINLLDAYNANKIEKVPFHGIFL